MSAIRLWDHVRLQHELLSRPRYVLRHFKRCHIGSLMELTTYLTIMQSDPAAAVRIALEATSMGIKIGDEGVGPAGTAELAVAEIDMGDVLASMKPGEV
jgi:hypothetical protein